MTLPVEYKATFRGVKQTTKDQPIFNALANLGTATNPRVKIVFNLTGISTDPISGNVALVVWIRYYSAAPLSNIRAFLEQSGTPIIQATEIYGPANLGVVATPLIFNFNIDNYSIGYEINSQFEIIIDTDATSPVKYYTIQYTTNNVDLESYFQQWQGTSYVTIGDAKFQLLVQRAKTFDISQYVKSIKVDRGMSDIDGSFVEGEADIGLFNRDNRFSPLNQSSPYYEYWDVQAVMTLTATYLSIVYPLFKGFIDRIRPDYEIDKRDVYISLSDYFARFKEKKISVNVTTNQPPHVIIGLLLDALGVPTVDRVLDTAETQALNIKNWQNENGFDALADVIESGQHSHYVNGAGKYYFQTNNWPPDKTPPDYDWDDCDVDDFKIEQDKKGIKNKFQVGNSTSGFFELLVPSSISRYGQKDQLVDNDLIPSLGYAQEVCLNLQARFSGRVNGIDLTLKNRLPDILTMDVGKMVQFTEPISGLNNDKFIPLGLTYDIRPAGDIQLQMKLKRFYQPPFILYTGTGLILVGPSIVGFKLEKFKMPVNGYISRVKTKCYISSTGTFTTYIGIYEDNGGALGSLMDLSSPVAASGPGDFESDRTMGLLGNILYEKDKSYWVGLLFSNPAAVFQMYGSNPGDYPDGSAYVSGGGGTYYPTIDFWFGLRIYPLPI